VAGWRVRSLGADPRAGDPADPGRGAGDGCGAQARTPAAHRRAGHKDPARPVRLGAVGAHPAAPLCAPGTGPAERRGAAGGVRPVRSRPAQPAVDRGCAARPARRRAQDHLVLLPRRPLPGGDGRPVRLPRGHRPARRGAQARAGRPWGARAGLRRQRLAVCGLLAAAGLRGPGHQAGALHTRKTARPRQDRAVLPHRPRPVPGRTRRRGCRPHRRPGRAEPAVCRLGRDRLPPPGPLRDRRAAAAALASRAAHPAAPAHPRPAPRGVLVGRAPHRHHQRDRVAARQHLPGRPPAGRPQGRAGLRPLRPHRHRGPLPAAHLRHRGRVPDRPPRPPQGPPRTARHPTPPPTGIDYLRLLDAAHQHQLAQRINYAALADADLDADGHPHPLPAPVLADRPDPTPADDDHDDPIHPEVPGQPTLTHPDPDQEPA
jgi:hypothetical protein